MIINNNEKGTIDIEIISRRFIHFSGKKMLTFIEKKIVKKLIFYYVLCLPDSCVCVY